jgi:N-acyl-L-homoserine lactone synthetase
MMYMVENDRFGEFALEIAEMHRLRYRVFKERLNWDVAVSGDMEIDEFDAMQPVYLLHRNDAGRVTGCVRLLPTTGPNMLRDSFPILLGPNAAPVSPHIWESSRFSLDVEPETVKTQAGLSRSTFELFAGMIEFGLSYDLTEIVTVTDVRMERILRRVGWPLRRIHNHHRIGNTLAVAGYVEVSHRMLDHIRSLGELPGPVLWEPVRPRAIA